MLCGDMGGLAHENLYHTVCGSLASMNARTQEKGKSAPAYAQERERAVVSLPVGEGGAVAGMVYRSARLLVLEVGGASDKNCQGAEFRRAVRR